MNRTFRLNTPLISSLGRVLGMTNTELMEATGIMNATWYRIMGHPDQITVQQLLSIANGLCIPVFRFFSNGDTDIIGRKNDYIENPYKPCYYDGGVLPDLVNSCSTATWQDVANMLGMSRTNLRNSLLSVTRLPVERFLKACEAFEIDPFFVIVDQNPQYVNIGGKNVVTTALKFNTQSEFATMKSELAELKVGIDKAMHDIVELGKKLDAIIGSYEELTDPDDMKQTAVLTKQVVKEIRRRADKDLTNLHYNSTNN